MLSWLQSNDDDVYALIARKNYPKAVKALQRQLQAEPESVHLRQTLADVWSHLGEPTKAVEILGGLADELVAKGFVTKAIAVLKKIQRIDPSSAIVEHRLSRLLEEQDGYFFEETRPIDVPVQGLLPRAARRRATERSEDPTDPATFRPRPPEETSELVSDWFEHAVDERRDFHWSPLLSGFGRRELAELIGGLRLLVKKPGAIVYGEDEPGESMFILSSGKCRLYRRDGSGRYQQVGMLHEGQFFGEASVLTVSQRLSTVTAVGECELLELDKRTFDRISLRNPHLRKTVQDLYQRRASYETASLGY